MTNNFNPTPKVITRRNNSVKYRLQDNNNIYNIYNRGMEIKSDLRLCAIQDNQTA